MFAKIFLIKLGALLTWMELFWLVVSRPDYSLKPCRLRLKRDLCTKPS